MNTISAFSIRLLTKRDKDFCLFIPFIFVCLYHLFFFYRINPNFVDSLLKLSHILSTQNMNGVESESLLKRAMEIKPNDPDIINNYGVLLNSLS